MGVGKIVKRRKVNPPVAHVPRPVNNPGERNLELEPQSECGNTYIFYPLSNFERQMRSPIANELVRSGSNINHELERSVEVDNKGSTGTKRYDAGN